MVDNSPCGMQIKLARNTEKTPSCYINPVI